MVKSIIVILSIIFVVIGLCEFIYALKMFFYHPNVRFENYSLVLLKKGYAIRQINYLWQKIKWYGDGYSSAIIAITDDLDYHEKLDCSHAFKNNKNIILCNVSEISECDLLQGS